MTESIWNVRKMTEKSQQSNRVRFVRMPGTRLSPPPPPNIQPVLADAPSQLQLYGESCASEAYFGDCSRDSSLERAPTPPASAKGRLYERGLDGEEESNTTARLRDVLDNAFKSFCQLHEEAVLPPPVVQKDWDETDGWNRLPTGGGEATANDNIWAPLDSDWALMGPEAPKMPLTWSSSSLSAPHSSPGADAAVQLSLALLNHHPEKSGFSPVLVARSLQKALPKNSKLMEWLANLASVGLGGSSGGGNGDDNNDEQEVEHILKEPERVVEDEEEENLLTSPKTHFCPIQQEGEAEVQVKGYWTSFFLHSHLLCISNVVN